MLELYLFLLYCSKKLTVYVFIINRDDFKFGAMHHIDFIEALFLIYIAHIDAFSTCRYINLELIS